MMRRNSRLSTLDIYTSLISHEHMKIQSHNFSKLRFLPLYKLSRSYNGNHLAM